MADLAKLVDELSSLTVIEAAELSKMLEEKWGVSAAAPVAVAAPAAGDGGGAAAEEEQTEFDVVLTGFGANKIAVIKEVRSNHGSGPQGGQAAGGERAQGGQGGRLQDEAEQIRRSSRTPGASGGGQVACGRGAARPRAAFATARV